MGIDYKNLCTELFGTNDVEELRKIADTIKTKNARNAGRKPKLSDSDIDNMERLRDEGMTLNEIAERYDTSRQIVSKYLNERPPIGCTMRMTYMLHQRPCTVIDIDFLNEYIFIQNKTDDILHRAFGINEKPTWEDFRLFLQDRCFPETRGNLKTALRVLGLSDYDPLQIVEKTSGRMADDDMWIKFKYYTREGAALGNN